MTSNLFTLPTKPLTSNSFILRIRNILSALKSEEGLVLASFVIQVESDRGIQQFWAEARKCPNAVAQIDWSDDLSALLFEFSVINEAHDYLNQAVFSTFLGKKVDYPIDLAKTT